MDTEGQILVVGGEGEATPPPEPTRPRVGPGSVGLVVVIALLAVLAGVGSDDPLSGVDETDLPAPAEPPSPPTTAAPSTTATPVEETIEWSVVELPGVGSVSDVSHGELGWLAVADGESLVAYTSVDGVEWTGRRLFAPVRNRFVSQSLVASDRMIVTVSAAGTVDGVLAWASTDGRSWDELVVPEDALTVSGLIEVNGRTLAAGSRAHPDGGQVAAVWSLEDDGTWVALEFDGVPSEGSAAVGFVRWGGATVALGNDEGFAGWTVFGARLVPIDISAPDSSMLVPTDVAPGQGGRAVALVEDRSELARQRWAVLESTDLRTWRRVEHSVPIPFAIGIGRIEDRPVVVGLDSRLLEIEAGQLIEGRNPPEAIVTASVWHDGVTVAGGIGAGDVRPKLWVAGADGTPLVIQPGTEIGAWTPVAMASDATIVDYPAGWFEQPSTALSGGDVFISNGGGPLIGIMDGIVSFDGPDTVAVYEVEDEVWRVDPAGILYRWAERQWEMQPPLEAWPAAVSVFQGTVRVVTDRGAVYELEGDRWVYVDRGPWPLPGPRRVSGIRNGFLATANNSTFISEDGVTWDEVDGLAGFASSGAPFLVVDSSDEASVIAVVAGWPDTLELRLPDPHPEEVLVIDDEIRVRTSSQLLVTEDGGSNWTSIPLDPLMIGRLLLLPTPEPVIASMSTDGTTFYAPTS